jgi:hypothetical protein
MTYTLNADRSAAVAIDYVWQPLSTAPRGCRILGLSKLGIARVDEFSGKAGDLIAWAPLPRRPHWLNELEGRS